MANKSNLPPLQPEKALKIPAIVPFNYDNAFSIDNWSIMDVVCALMEDELRVSYPAKLFLKHGILTIDPCIINEDDKGRNHLLSLMRWGAGEDNDNSERTPLYDLAKACKAFSGGEKLGSGTSDGCYCPPLSDEDERTIPLDLLLMSFILPDNKETRNDYPALKNTKEWRIWGENVASLRETILRTISYLSDSKLFGDKNKPIKSLDEILEMLSSTMGKETIILRLKDKVFPYFEKREIKVKDSYKELVEDIIAAGDSKNRSKAGTKSKTTSLPITSNMAETPKPNYIFRNKGDFWEISFDGSSPVHIKNTIGMLYIQELLKIQPSIGIACNELYCLQSPIPTTNSYPYELNQDGKPNSKSNGVLDQTAVKNYKSRLKKLHSMKNNPKYSFNEEEKDKIKEEIAKLEDMLRKNIGKNGKPRNFSDRANKRSTVTQAIKTAINKIRKSNENAGNYFGDSIQTGELCSYRPIKSPPPDWVFE